MAEISNYRDYPNYPMVPMVEQFTLVAGICAVFIGLTLGMLGGGGAILTVPALVYIIGFSAKPAIAMTLPVIGVTSLVGALVHLRSGNLNLRIAAIFGAITMVGAFLGGRLSQYFSGMAQLIILSCVMIISAVMMFRGNGSKKPAEKTGEGIAEGATGTGSDTIRYMARLTVVGFFVGILTGIVGIGGGFMIVPALVILGNVDMRKAVGTSLLVISFTTAAGYAGQASHIAIPWKFVAFFTLAAVFGSLVGAHFSSRIPVPTLKKGFAILIVVIGVSMLAQNLLALR